MIIDMVNKEHKQVVETSFQNDSKVIVSSQEKPKVKGEALLSPFSPSGAHDHLPQASSPFLGEESGQVITNFCEGDVEIKEAKQRETCLKEEVLLSPFAHSRAHDHLPQASSPLSGEESVDVAAL